MKKYGTKLKFAKNFGLKNTLFLTIKNCWGFGME